MTAVLDAPAAAPDGLLPSGEVFWAWIHGEDVRAAFMSSVIATLTSPNAALVGSFFDYPSGPVLSIARNTCAESFLASGQEWLWFVDSDTVFGPDTLARLLALADPVERPVLAAAVPILGRSARSEAGGLPDLFWSAFTAAPDGGLDPIGAGTPLDEVVRVDAVGTGCVLIHRTVLEAVGPGPFCEESSGGAVIGEDLAFCRRCDKLGIPVHLAAQVRVGHAKVVTL